MAGTADMPTILVEITISCRNLRDADVFSKSDPMCVILHRPPDTNKWTEYKRTEWISNTLNPEFSTKIPYHYSFEMQQPLKFCLYDIDSESQKLNDHDFLGELEITLGQLVSTGFLEKPLIDKNQHTNCGTIVLLTEELNSCKEELTIQFVGKDFVNNKWFQFFDPCYFSTISFGSINPFLEFYKSNEDGSYTLVHRTEKAHKTNNPVWKSFNLPLRTFCSGDYDRNIKVIAKDYITSGDHQEFGVFYTTVRKLADSIADNSYAIVNESKRLRQGDNYKPVGTVHVNLAIIKKVDSFLDYLKGGTELNAFIGIDFTASNGNPQDPKSLHYIRGSTPNQYVRAISAVTEIIEDYDSDKFFPVLGFGARQPPEFDTVSHEFFVNADPANPFCYKVQGVLDAYYSCLGRVQLYGPTNFAPIINHVAKFADCNHNGDKYFILLMITDGIITDMAITKEAIVNASSLPLSIIIVGVGNADFSAMEELDGDVVRLSHNGRYAERDIVQFVPFRDFLEGPRKSTSAKVRLAQEVLAEVPGQLVSYMSANNITPNTPKVKNSALPPDPKIASAF